MKKIVIAAIALVCALNANAQVGTVTSRTIKTTTTTREVEVDFNKYNRLSLSFASFKYNYSAEDLEYYFKEDKEGRDGWPGAIVEYIHGWRLMKSQPLFLESGLAAQFNINNSIHFGLTIPVNITYHYATDNGFYIAPLVGLTLGSHVYDDYLFEELDDFDYKYDIDASQKYFQLGYNVGVNLGYKRLNIGVGYRGDFMPVGTVEDYGNIKTGTFYAGIGVNF